MGCRCAERRVALKRTTEAIADGDVETAAKQAVFVVRSTVEDAAAALRNRTAAAKARLMRR